MAHMQYKGTGKVHSFRGLLPDGKQQKIRIQGATGEIAWRITKFQVMGNAPSGSDHESIVKIYREEQSSITTTIDFGDDELLASAIWTAHGLMMTYPLNQAVIFDNALFSRNIWVSQEDKMGNSNACNYYIELEEVKLSAAGMAQLAVAAARRTID